MRNPRRQLVVWLFMTTLLAICGPSSSAKFKWTASIDRSTGIATSQEASIVPSSCSLYRAVTSSTSPSELVQHVFLRYPSWLASWKVTFGFLRAIPCGTESEETDVCDSLFGVTLLSFGRSQFRKARRQRRTREYNVMIPIVGGLMTLPSSKGTYGSLSFSLIQGGDADSALRLETSIANDYRPTIAGLAPVSRLRAGIYRSTQSLVHAYVMWRFHHYCYHQSQ